jgi:hypothetical protein
MAHAYAFSFYDQFNPYGGLNGFNDFIENDDFENDAQHNDELRDKIHHIYLRFVRFYNDNPLVTFEWTGDGFPYFSVNINSPTTKWKINVMRVMSDSEYSYVSAELINVPNKYYTITNCGVAFMAEKELINWVIPLITECQVITDRQVL